MTKEVSKNTIRIGNLTVTAEAIRVLAACGGKSGNATGACDTHQRPDLQLTHAVGCVVSYDLDRWTFSLGGNNITNVYPEKDNAANYYHGILTYPLSSPFGFKGAHWYGTIAYRW